MPGERDQDDDEGEIDEELAAELDLALGDEGDEGGKDSNRSRVNVSRHVTSRALGSVVHVSWSSDFSSLYSIPATAPLPHTTSPRSLLALQEGEKLLRW